MAGEFDVVGGDRYGGRQALSDFCGEAWAGENAVRCVLTVMFVGFEGSIYPASVGWEAPFVRSKPRGVKLFEHKRCGVFTTLVREDEAPFAPHGELVSLTVDSEGAASLVWEPMGVEPASAGAPGAIVVQVCAHDPLRLTANGALLLER